MWYVELNGECQSLGDTASASECHSPFHSTFFFRSNIICCQRQKEIRYYLLYRSVFSGKHVFVYAGIMKMCRIIFIGYCNSMLYWVTSWEIIIIIFFWIVFCKSWQHLFWSTSWKTVALETRSFSEGLVKVHVISGVLCTWKYKFFTNFLPLKQLLFMKQNKNITSNFCRIRFKQALQFILPPYWNFEIYYHLKIGGSEFWNSDSCT